MAGFEAPIDTEKAFDAFVRDYLAFKTRASKQERAEDIYQAFRRNFVDLQESCGDLESVLAEMLRLGRYYAAFNPGIPLVAELAADLARLRRLVDAPSLLVMRLFDCHDRCKTLSLDTFREAIHTIESYVFRRVICGEQTRGYWLVFANLSYRIEDEKPLQDLKIGLARLRDTYRFPTDPDFRRELVLRDIFGLRVCGYLLDRLENHGSKEPTNTSTYTIEHIMPQNEKLPEAWQTMLGQDWKKLHPVWLHRLGNLTLIGYNSTYSDRSFEEKKTIPCGFAESSVRLNKWVREQAQWTPAEIEQRGEMLANRSLVIWPALEVEPSAIESAKQAEMRELHALLVASKCSISSSEASARAFSPYTSRCCYAYAQDTLAGRA